MELRGKIKNKTFVFFGFCSLVAVGAGAFWKWNQIQERSAMSSAIREQFKDILLPLPEPPFERVLGRIPSAEIVELGRQLFNDPILSRNNDVSCATCHLSNHGFSDGQGLPFGALGRGGPTGDTVGKTFAHGKLNLDRNCGDDGLGFDCIRPFFRNVPSTMNAIFRADPFADDGLLLDGRFGRLTFQTLLPITQPEELCGTNPVPGKPEDNLFRPGGPLFPEPIVVASSHAEDLYSGIDRGLFDAPPKAVAGVPGFRPTGAPSVPTRNECLAIAVAKLRAVEKYRKLFEEAFGTKQIRDGEIGVALASFISTHAMKDSPFDQFVGGENSLSPKQLLGLAIFSSQPGVAVSVAGKSGTGAGCINCHAPPHFGSGFASLGVVSDPRSILSVPRFTFDGLGINSTTVSQRGVFPKCHFEGETAVKGQLLAPDIGRALVTTKTEDCFKFRVPTLRNVVETYPYFHHGTEKGQGSDSTDLKVRSMVALENVIKYHLRGPVNRKVLNAASIYDNFFDPFYQLDPLVSYRFTSFQRGPAMETTHYPIELKQEEVDALLDFVATGLRDPHSNERGFLGNDVSHPRRVASGFSPSVTRDQGTQQELPPGVDEAVRKNRSKITAPQEVKYSSSY